jgi:hypothetical protein
MRVRIEVGSKTGVVAVGDPETAWPAGLDQEARLRQLRPLARSAQLFFLVTDDDLLSVFARRPFDGKRYAEDMDALLGRDAKFMQIVDRLGLIGCLPMILVAISLLMARWRWLWYLVPLLVVSWLPYLVLKRGRRYRSAEKRAAEAESARPHYVLSLAPTQQAGVGQCQAYLPYGQEGVLVQTLRVDEATGLLASRYAPERYREHTPE